MMARATPGRLSPLSLSLWILLAWALALVPAHGRIKIDRYEAGTLPVARLWVTFLRNGRPVELPSIQGFSVYAAGQLTPDPPEVQTAKALGRPMAIAVVLDGRYLTRWNASRSAIEGALSDLPDDSIALAVVTHEASTRMPAEGWSDRPSELAGTLSVIEASGVAPRLYRGVRQALRGFPMARGLEHEEDDGPVPPPPRKGAPAFPDDRVLYVIGDGELQPPNVDTIPGEQLSSLVRLARRRGVRVMTVGLVDDDARSLWTLRILARKTGGTYRLASTERDVKGAVGAAAAELAGRYVLDATVPNLRRGDELDFAVSAALKDGSRQTSRAFTARADNVLGFWEGVVDAVSDWWEGSSWWVKALVIGGVVLLLALIVLIKLWKRRKKRRKAAEAKAQARSKALAGRRPCGVCGQTMMPDWDSCLFCAQTQKAVVRHRFRLTGRSGLYAGRALQFNKELVLMGATRQCDIQIPERGVSAEHCGIRDRGEAFLLTDFNTDGGTWLNGERISQAEIKEGDVIRVGETEFVFGVEA